MKLFCSKKVASKGQIKTSKRLIIMVVMIAVIVVGLISGTIVSLIRGVSDCKGECSLREDCPRLYISSSKCYVDGKLQEGKVCCLRPGHITGDDDSGDASENGEPTDQPEPPVSSICNEQEYPLFTWGYNDRRGRCFEENDVKLVEYCNVNTGEKTRVEACEIPFTDNYYYLACCDDAVPDEEFVRPWIEVTFGDRRTMNIPTYIQVGESLDFYVFSEGSEVASCSISTYNPDTGRYIVEGNLAIDKQISGNCDDVKININPREEDYNLLIRNRFTATFELIVTLKDSSDNKIKEEETRFTVLR